MPTSTNPSMQTPIKSFNSENFDPNLPIPSTPPQKPTKTPLLKSSTKLKKVIPPPPPQQQQNRKFIIAKKKKNARNGAEKTNDFDPEKCCEGAYEALRASHEDFFKKDCDESDSKAGGNEEVRSLVMDEKSKDFDPFHNDCFTKDVDRSNLKGGKEKGEGKEVEKMRSLVMNEALSCLPEPRSGRVKHLVKAFESLLSISDDNEGPKSEGRSTRVMKGLNWELPWFEEPTMMGDSCSAFSLPKFVRDSRLCSSFDSNGQRLSLGSMTFNGSRRSRRSSLDSSRRSWNKKLKVTSQRPFKLRTEQRGRQKEEIFLKKVKEMLMEEEKKRIPIAQGLPWTTDEPECLVKPPVKKSTEPIDLVLHSDVRAVERLEFDQYVAEHLSFIEQIKLERERQQKLEEVEEIRRLRRELVPKAQPMPYFDRPFVPKKSARARTVPKEPKFHVRPMKSSCVRFLCA